MHFLPTPEVPIATDQPAHCSVARALKNTASTVVCFLSSRKSVLSNMVDSKMKLIQHPRDRTPKKTK